MIVIPEWYSPCQLPLAAHQSPRPGDVQIVEMQALVDYMDQVGTAIFAELNSVFSLILLLARTLFLLSSMACTCQCTRKFCLLVRTLLRALAWVLRYMMGGNKVTTPETSKDGSEILRA